MKAAELRLGNWYQYLSAHTGKWKESKIRWQEIKDAAECPKDWKNKKEIKPIPLTEEELEKFDGDFKYEDGLITIRVIGMFPDGCRHTRFQVFSIKELKYLHRFQNLYFALTGKELKIKQEASV